ncbi:hypothetical protein DWE98_12050 [Bosea caraganae]|uniref:Uncharacterized protein n=1 Tax=Bosea caraganae TaxID=2763117 RepID=A0A370L741_9HYPH|nr:hypothetical protein DWE98_12050 [Bosea caraganae]
MIAAAAAVVLLGGCSTVSSMFSSSPSSERRPTGDLVESSQRCQGRGMLVGSPEMAQCLDQARAGSAAPAPPAGPARGRAPAPSAEEAE